MPGAVWLGATLVLGRPAPVDEPYPHLCSLRFVSPRNGERMWIGRKDCAACLHEAHQRRQLLLVDVHQLPPLDPEIIAAEARRLGEHD